MALTNFVAGQVLEAQQLDDSFAAVDWNENVIINGAMQVAQYGTSTASITTSGIYTADRWNLEIDTMGTWTETLEADAPTGSGFRNSVKLLCTTADASPGANDVVQFQQRTEGFNLQQFAKGTANAKTFCMSFWVKSNVTGTYIAQLLDVPNSRSVSASYTISASGVWEQKTITFPADTTGAFANDNVQNLQTRFWLGAGSARTSGTLQTTWGSSATLTGYAVGQTNVAAAINNYWQVTGVQVQPERASQFAFMDYGTVLAQCQRYFVQKSGTTYETGFFNVNSANLAGSATFPVTMRATPTIAIYNLTTVNQVALIGGGTGTVTGVSAISDRGFSGISGSGLTGLGGAVFSFLATAEI